MKLKWLHKAAITDFLMSISFSVFGMLLIFGLGFVFPTINPYVVIKWIIIVASVVFGVSFLKYVYYVFLKVQAILKMRKDWKKESPKAKRGGKK
jgi:hypothetical protein